MGALDIESSGGYAARNGRFDSTARPQRYNPRNMSEAAAKSIRRPRPKYLSQRIVTGAHYGLRDWLAQRITAVIMAVYSVIAVIVLFSGKPITYAVWRDLFAHGWMRVATLMFAASLAWHAWVGVRDILMDYIKPAGLRLTLEVLVLLTIAAYVGWTIQILWR